MTFKQLCMFCYSGISTILIIRILFFILGVDLGKPDGHDMIRLFLCASVSIILLSRVYLYLIQPHKELYAKVKEPLVILGTLLAIVDLIFIIGFFIMKQQADFDTFTLLDWLKLLFWSS